MERLTTDTPQTNMEILANFAYAKDKEVRLTYGDGLEDVALADYIVDHAKTDFGCSVTRENVINGDSCWECDCPLAILNATATQAAELRGRLMKYENTGLTPDDYLKKKEQLHVLNLFLEQSSDAEDSVRNAEARRENRLVILPCKVGDMVYYRRGSYIIGDDVKRIVLDGIDNQVIIDHNHSFMFSDFGRKVWSSREEAEAALKGENK